MVEPFRSKRRKFLHGCAASFTSFIIPTPLFSDVSESFNEFGLNSSEKKELDREVRRFMETFLVPGLSIAIAKQGRLVINEAFGFTDILKQEILKPSHRFRIASLSKPLTAAAIFKLIQAQRVSLFDRVFSPEGILCNLIDPNLRSSFLEEVTIDHLLSHKVGEWQNDHTDPMLYDLSLSSKDLINLTLKKRPLSFLPGNTYRYSNFGYFLLGRVIEAVTQIPYGRAMHDLVFSQCGMRSLELAKNSFKDKPTYEVTYLDQEGNDPYALNLERSDASGGWISTAEDLARFLVRLDFSETAPCFLGSDYVQLMTTPQSSDYARGWCINRWNNWWHLGCLPGTVSFMVHTYNGFCMVALANTCMRKNEMQVAIDQLMMRLINKIKKWPNINLFL